ncbi:hypothetical protein HWB92_gp189 [Serratia phage vB_SmaA_3M]|uniref:Uncharacterized protein n=1 Tax=Serratia phage vB_SmaA_3M TaxID=2419930 RepID=A0A3G2YSF9_9CAUD|nr:hypothetical protein HWB92_gp189 [Serratia phage vB_SmaA_3M]AYP28447.1 hypothetical protein 3M_191c [Serratia phage vB_SmaA_3M]
MSTEKYRFALEQWRLAWVDFSSPDREAILAAREQDIIDSLKPEPQTGYVFRRVIVAAACKYGDVIITGARHYDRVMHGQLKAFSEDSELRMMSRGEVIQGFIDNQGNFHNREEALVIAREAGQIRFKHPPEHELFSEDLY